MSNLYICRRCRSAFARLNSKGRAPHYCAACKSPKPSADGNELHNQGARTMTTDELGAAVDAFIQDLGQGDALASDLADALLARAMAIGVHTIGRRPTARVLMTMAEYLLHTDGATTADAMLAQVLGTKH